ncbi:MAG: hypothetical protein Q9216_006952 [Gyalolechia sp. 2 TL-2023]
MPIVQVTPEENRELQNIANILASSKKIVMVTGAGISTNCGIPDFRSDDGLYALIQSQYKKVAAEATGQCGTSIPYAQNESTVSRRHPTEKLPTNVKGKDLFDARIWKDPTSTSVFYTFIASLRRQIREEVKQTTATHRFIRTIRDSRKLVRCYTQNIDGLESRLGLCMDLERGRGHRSRFTAKSTKVARVVSIATPSSSSDGGCEVVPLHGDLSVLRCTLCQQMSGWEESGREASFLRGKAPECFSCARSDQQRRDRGKRGTKIGSLRPNVVLYGEEHPAADAVGSITTHDLSLAPDVLLILGTSLHVQGVKTLVKEFARCVHARPKAKGKVIFVNLSKPPESIWKDSIDYWVSMDCDAWVGALRRHRPDIWQLQTELKARVVKKGTQQSPKVSTPRKSKMTDVEEKENVPLIPLNPTSPYRKSPGRAKKPLGEMKAREELRVKGQNRPVTSHIDSEPDVPTCQLPTPPPSGHKHSFRGQGWKRNRDQEDLELPATPTKRFRTSTIRHDALDSSIRSRVSEGTKHSHPPSKRKNVEVKVWED